MKGRISNKMGEIQISPDVIALYAGTIAVECFGIVGMAAVSMKDGLVKLLKEGEPDPRHQSGDKGQSNLPGFSRDCVLRSQHIGCGGQPD